VGGGGVGGEGGDGPGGGIPPSHGGSDGHINSVSAAVAALHSPQHSPASSALHHLPDELESSRDGGGPGPASTAPSMPLSPNVPDMSDPTLRPSQSIMPHPARTHAGPSAAEMMAQQHAVGAPSSVGDMTQRGMPPHFMPPPHASPHAHLPPPLSMGAAAHSLDKGVPGVGTPSEELLAHIPMDMLDEMLAMDEPDRGA
jgi:hypothetical protein